MRPVGVASSNRVVRDPQALFARHLDLAPLGSRRRGLVRCIFHQDCTPSLSVDLDAGIFHCFGCGTGGGVRQFVELVGESSGESSASPRGSDDPHRLALRVLHAQPWARPGVVELYRVADGIRRRYRLVDRARRLATAAGDNPRSWSLLAVAARVELEAVASEAALDEVRA